MKLELNMIEKEKNDNNDAAMENNTEPITKSGRMKHGWDQTINNTVCYCQNPFKIAVILEKV